MIRIIDEDVVDFGTRRKTGGYRIRKTREGIAIGARAAREVHIKLG